MDPQTGRRIDRILSTLRPRTAFDGTFGPPQMLRERLAFYRTPGASIAVIDNSEVAWARGFGFADARTKRKVTAGTLFQTGSISKAIFALGVMRLAQEGRLNLDEDVQRYLATWRVPANGDWQPRITLRALLSHTAGLTVSGFPGYPAGEPLPTLTQVLNGAPPANTAKVEVNILPGLHARYSGGGTTVAQQAVMDLLGQPFPQIMRERVLDPLGMADSTYEQPLPKRRTPRAATAHPWKGKPLKGRFHTYPEMAAAGLWSTPTDLAKAGAELLKTLRGGNAPGLLPRESIEAMLRPPLPGQGAGGAEFMSLGFFCVGQGDGFHFGHGGWNEGFVARMRLYPRLGKGAVVMLNSNQGNPLIDELLRAIGEAHGWPDAAPYARVIVRVENLPRYAGRYAAQGGIPFTVSVAGDSLRLQVGEQPPLPMFPSAETEFFATATNTGIRFEMDGQGDVVALTVSQEGQQTRADRQ